MTDMPRIDIVLSTYNGQQYLQELLDSIAGQSYPNWRLLVRDDGSQDRTVGILQRYCDTVPGKITLMDEPRGNLGVVGSYSALLGRSDADYTMLADQDDVWLPEKIAVTLEEMRRTEQRPVPGTPALVHTDAAVVDAGLAAIAPSLWHYQKSDPKGGAALNRLLLQNIATGCTAMINKHLRGKALPFPQEAIMHDWWLALTASSFGVIGYVPKATLLYRQHQGNKLGAEQWNARAALRMAGRMSDTIRTRKAQVEQSQNQARAFLERYASSLGNRDRAMLEAFADLSSHGYLMRRYYMMKYGFFYSDMARNIGRLLIA